MHIWEARVEQGSGAVTFVVSYKFYRFRQISSKIWILLLNINLVESDFGSRQFLPTSSSQRLASLAVMSPPDDFWDMVPSRFLHMVSPPAHGGTGLCRSPLKLKPSSIVVAADRLQGFKKKLVISALIASEVQIGSLEGPLGNNIGAGILFCRWNVYVGHVAVFNFIFFPLRYVLLYVFAFSTLREWWGTHVLFSPPGYLITLARAQNRCRLVKASFQKKKKKVKISWTRWG